MNYPYLDSSLSPKTRADDLISHMTLAEKVGQMCQYTAPPKSALSPDELQKLAANDDATANYSKDEINAIPKLIQQGLIGSILNCYDVSILNQLQELTQKSRLKIPMIMAGDAIHGNAMYRGATVFPTPVSLAATWDTSLAKQMAQATAKECRAVNIHWNFSPSIDIARDGRWGRMGETFGEDPYLVAKMGRAMVEGYEGDLSQDNVLSCAKHLIAGGEPDNGINFAPMEVSERTLRQMHLPPYQEAIEAGTSTIMAAHNEVNGVPCHASKWLMQDLVKGEYGFDGVIVSDWTDVARLYTLHNIAESIKEANFLSVDAGLDLHMHGPGFLDEVIELVEEGRISQERIDDSVRRILLLKFRLGLFENPLADETNYDDKIATDEHRQIALNIARKSITLLKNDGILPLDKSTRKILITGPGADSHMILGDWVKPQPDENVTTLFKGLQDYCGSDVDVRHCPSGDYDEITPEKISKAAELAKEADVVLVTFGENGLRYTNNKTEGENVDRSSFELMGLQQELVQALYASNSRTIGLVIAGKPVDLSWMKENLPGLFYLFNPGMEGGKALAEILFGTTNPSGRLPITLPRNVGQLGQVYNHKPSAYFRKYIDGPICPNYPFGYGLSYTTFAYSNLSIPATITQNGDITVTVDIENTGDTAGEEVSILYVNDVYSSVTTPVKQVAGFQRTSLQPGEQKTVSFTIENRQLSLWDVNMEQVVEKGLFEVSIAELKGSFEVV